MKIENVIKFVVTSSNFDIDNLVANQITKNSTIHELKENEIFQSFDEFYGNDDINSKFISNCLTKHFESLNEKQHNKIIKLSNIFDIVFLTINNITHKKVLWKMSLFLESIRGAEHVIFRTSEYTVKMYADNITGEDIVMCDFHTKLSEKVDAHITELVYNIEKFFE